MIRDVPVAIAQAIERVLQDTGRKRKSLEPALLLAADVGLDSLDLAHTIVLLEQQLGIDPFRSASTNVTIRTVSDLITLYETALLAASPFGNVPE